MINSNELTEMELTANNPWRPVDWRWQRALRIHQGEFKRCRLYDDAHILGAVRYLTVTSNTANKDAVHVLATRMPGVFWAIKMHQNPLEAWKYEAEARILAGESNWNICRRMEERPHMLDALNTYENLFFDVRSRLHNRAYVLHMAIGQALHRGFKEGDYGLIWKFYGYTYGPKMLDAIIEQAVAPSHPRTRDEVAHCLEDDGMASMLRKQALATRMVPINAFTMIDIMNVYSKFVEIARVSGEARSVSSNTLMANVQKMMEMLPVTVGNQELGSDVDHPLIAKYDNSSTELPTVQLLSAAVGKPITDFEAYGDLAYPEPINHARVDPSGTN